MIKKGFLRKITWQILYELLFVRHVIMLHHTVSKQEKEPKLRLVAIDCLDKLIEVISGDEGGLKTVLDSKTAYDKYDDREIIEEEMGRDEYMVDPYGRVEVCSERERRSRQLELLYTYIDDMLKKDDKVSILEVGCGNLINAHLTTEKYKEKVDYYGIDISQKRIEIGLKHYRELDSSFFKTSDITKGTEFSDNQFDIVFSMHCLEQVSYETNAALREIYRVCKRKIIMIEPIFENGTFRQRCYLILSDHDRILLKSIQELGLNVEKNEKNIIQAGVSNQSSLIVIKK